MPALCLYHLHPHLFRYVVLFFQFSYKIVLHFHKKHLHWVTHFLTRAATIVGFVGPPTRLGGFRDTSEENPILCAKNKSEKPVKPEC